MHVHEFNCTTVFSLKFPNKHHHWASTGFGSLSVNETSTNEVESAVGLVNIIMNMINDGGLNNMSNYSIFKGLKNILVQDRIWFGCFTIGWLGYYYFWAMFTQKDLSILRNMISISCNDQFGKRNNLNSTPLRSYTNPWNFFINIMILSQ